MMIHLHFFSLYSFVGPSTMLTRIFSSFIFFWCQSRSRAWFISSDISYWTFHLIIMIICESTIRFLFFFYFDWHFDLFSSLSICLFVCLSNCHFWSRHIHYFVISLLSICDTYCHWQSITNMILVLDINVGQTTKLNYGQFANK